MTYLKTLIALTTLALLTACAGGVTVNPTIVKTDDPDTTALCITNPFGTGCAVLTEPQAEAFCRDVTKTTDTKTADCAPTVMRLCGEDVFDGLCTTPTEPQAETFCRDTSKTPDNKATNCAPTVMRVCDDNPYDAGLCLNNNDYTTERQRIRLTCTSADDNVRDTLCPMAVATECTTDPFLAVCRLGTAGADDGTYGQARATQILATCAGENGEGFGNVFDPKCSDVEPYQTEKDRITNECESGGGNTNTCPADVVRDVCIGNPWNTVLCRDPAIDYSTQRMERLEACKGTNTLDGCVAAAATTCPTNPFQTGICFIGTTYMSQRDSETLACRGTPNGANCGDAQTAVCTLNAFDAFCKDVALFIGAQIDGCADATATTAQCNALFATELAGCLQDPFSPGCDTEATFMDSKVSVRKKRFDFCKTVQTNVARCVGYTTCNDALVFAPLTCGANFQPGRVAFCKIAKNAFDAGCVDDLIDATAQLEYCKLSTANLFGTDCKKDAFTQARIEFCMDTPDNDDCRADSRREGLMSVPIPTDPCAGGACVDVADLPTYPTAPAEKTPDATDDFADGILSVTLIAPTGGKSLLNPDGTENTTISTSAFPTGTTVREEITKFRRRGGRGSSDADGLVVFSLLKTGAGEVDFRTSTHAAILPTTNLGVPLTDGFTSAVWSGHFYNDNGIHSTDFYITFDGTAGAIGFANPVGSTPRGIGTGADRPAFAIANNVIMAVAFDARGVLSGTLSSDGAFVPMSAIIGLIGTEGVVGVAVGALDSAVGFTATNPDGGTVPVVDPCIGGLAACYGTHDFWRSNARNSANNDFLRVRLASAGMAVPADLATNLVTGDATVLNALGGDGITVSLNYNVTLDDLNEVSNSEDIKSGFGLALALSDDRTINSFYVGLLSGTNVGAPFTNTNQPAAEWTGLVSLYASASNNFRDVPITLEVSFDDTNGGSIGHATGEYTYFTEEEDPDSFDIRRFSINGKFDANGVIYGTTTYRYPSLSINDEELSLSGLIGVNGAVAVFGRVSAGDSGAYVGGFVARPKPASGG